MPGKATASVCKASLHIIQWTAKKWEKNLEVLKPYCYHLLPRLNSALLKKIEIKAKSQESLQNIDVNLVALENAIHWQNEKEPQSCAEQYPLLRKGSRQLLIQV